MREFAGNLEFEKAAALRDDIADLRRKSGLAERELIGKL
jgi:protein-arginine kinase activator protein McsA